MQTQLTERSAAKNTHPGKSQTLISKEDLQLISIEQENPEDQSSLLMKSGIIHFYFCLEGSAQFDFSPQYGRQIARNRNYFFYNPDKDLPFTLTLREEARLVYLSISLESLHNLFVGDSHGLPILNKENAMTKFYDEREIPSSLRLVLTQLFTVRLSEAASRLFYQGKVYEILGLYFSHRTPDVESCPFLNDQETVRKIKHAKDHLLKNIESPPGLKELSKLAGLNESQLKTGFKEVYGNTVYGYLLDHKMDHARDLLDTGRLKVNEAAYQVGYSNTSHFIAAFKKKFGVTPKKYLMRK